MSDALVVKYCPACGQENLPNESFCTECDFDLLTVPSEPRRDLLDAEAASPEAGPTDAESSSATDFCRLELLDDRKSRFKSRQGKAWDAEWKPTFCCRACRT